MACTPRPQGTGGSGECAHVAESFQFAARGDIFATGVSLPEMSGANRLIEARNKEIAEKLAAAPPQAVQSTKRALNMHMKRAIAGVLEYALASEYQSFDTPEHQAIVNGFVERSKARAAKA